MQVVSLVVVHHVSESCQVVVTNVGASECELCSRLSPLRNRHQFVDVRMATADGFVHPAVPSLDNVVRPGRGGMDVPHGWREISVEPRGVVVHHRSVQRRVQLY